MFFHTPHAEYKAKRITQLLTETGEAFDHNIYARADGQVLYGSSGHLFLFDLNELGQVYKVDNVDCVPAKSDNIFTIAG